MFSEFMPITNLFGNLFFKLFGWKDTEFFFYHNDGSINYNIPLSDATSVIILTTIYLVSIFGIQIYMKERQPLKLKLLFAVHNILLSFFSLVLLILLLETLIPIWWNHGFYYSICSQEMWYGGQGRRLELYYYINYLFKFYELIDTYFMALSKKNPEFLHVYHHVATVWLCFVQLHGNTSVQWFVISLNLFVHVVMYYYYARAALGLQTWWKKYLTTIQIVQFLCDLCIVYFCLGVRYVALFLPDLGMDCHGSIFAAYVGCAILTSYLSLFINFFRKTYSGLRTKKD